MENAVAVAPTAPAGASPLVASPEHPLASLGLDINSNEGPALLASLGQLPGAAQAEQAREAAATEALVQQQQPRPSAEPQASPWQAPQLTPEPNLAQPPTAQPGQVQAFNQQLAQGQAVELQQQTQPEESYATKADHDFLVGLVQDQADYFETMRNPAVAATGAPDVSATLAPAQYQAPQAESQIPPIAVPKLAPIPEITEDRFTSITGDRKAFSAFLAERDQAIAATVTEQLAATVLPHVQGYIAKQAENERAISVFMAANPDLAEHPDALNEAVSEANQKMPYAKPERIMYYAGKKLRGAMATNQVIEANVHDLRGKPTRRAPVITNPTLRRGPGNEVPANPFGQMASDMIAQRQHDVGVLEKFGLTGAPRVPARV